MTEKQRRYAEKRAAGKGPVEAYRETYDTTTGNKATQRRMAYDVEKNRNVAAMIEDLKRKSAERALLSRQDLAQWLLDQIGDADISPGVKTAYAKLYADIIGARGPVQVELAGGVNLALSDKTVAAENWLDSFTRADRPQDGPRNDENTAGV